MSDNRCENANEIIEDLIRDEEDIESYIDDVKIMSYSIKHALSRSTSPETAAEEITNLLGKNRDDMEAQGLPNEEIEELMNYHLDSYIAMLFALDQEEVARAFLYRSRDKAQYAEGE